MTLLKNKKIDGNAEFFLSLTRNHTEDIPEYLPEFLEKFPNMRKNIFYFCDRIPDKETISRLIEDFTEKVKNLSKYQIFCLEKLLDAYLLAKNST